MRVEVDTYAPLPLFFLVKFMERSDRVDEQTSLSWSRGMYKKRFDDDAFSRGVEFFIPEVATFTSREESVNAVDIGFVPGEVVVGGSSAEENPRTDILFAFKRREDFVPYGTVERGARKRGIDEIDLTFSVDDGVFC